MNAIDRAITEAAHLADYSRIRWAVVIHSGRLQIVQRYRVPYMLGALTLAVFAPATRGGAVREQQRREAA